MGETRTGGLSWEVALRLGRVSNLPTVWTNVAAGLALSGAGFTPVAFLVLSASLSFFYIAGMYLNDAFDREIDARERPERPIPSGAVSGDLVMATGFALLVAGWLVLAGVSYLGPAGTGWAAPLAGAVLAAAIVLYDVWHKANPLSPVLMGICRLLVYVTAALAVAGVASGAVLVAACVALAYLIGLTYAAKQETLSRVENLWPLGFLAIPALYALWAAVSGWAGLAAALAFLGWAGYALSFLLMKDRIDVPRAVVSLIAGISLLDAVFIAGAGYPLLALIAGAAFLLTLALQRHVAGT